MKLNIQCIVGLGNPGPQYQNTRHNAGFWFVDSVAQNHEIKLKPEAKFFASIAKLYLPSKTVWLIKPETYMNRSGMAVAAFCQYYKIPPESLLVVHDDLDLIPGRTKIKFAGGHGGHNGLRDIGSSLGSKEFYRLRVGIGHPGTKDQVVDYVLSRPNPDDLSAILVSIDNASKLVAQIVDGELQQLMNKINES